MDSANLLCSKCVELPHMTDTTFFSEGSAFTQTMTTTLSPAQQRAHDAVVYALPLTSVVGLSGVTGSGKSTVVQTLCAATGGVVLTLKDLVEAMRARHPLALEETFYQMVLDALAG